MMEAVRTSETLVDNHFTRQYNPEDNSEHHTRRRENLKSHKTHILCKPDIPNIGTETASYKVLPLGNMFIVWMVYASLSATPSTPLIPLLVLAQIFSDYSISL
jgi:hypothetical protein